jgi:hypothetical protein
MSDCRLPRTATRRGAISYVKLIEKVLPHAENAAGFVGRLLRPGALIEEEELFTAPGRNPVLLESTDALAVEGNNGKRKYDRLYLLWRYEQPSKSWIEIARSQSWDNTWVYALRDPARVALGRDSWRVVPTVIEASVRIGDLLDAELSDLPDHLRTRVLERLYEEIGSRFADI